MEWIKKSKKIRIKYAYTNTVYMSKENSDSYNIQRCSTKKYLDVKKLFGCGMRNDKSDLLSPTGNRTEIENSECNNNIGSAGVANPGGLYMDPDSTF